MANIQMPEKFFSDVMQLLYILDDYDLGQPADELSDHIRAQIEDKLNRMNRRELYTRFKAAGTPEEREQARKTYLDAAGIPADYRWKQEDHP